MHYHNEDQVEVALHITYKDPVFLFTNNILCLCERGLSLKDIFLFLFFFLKFVLYEEEVGLVLRLDKVT